MSEEIKFTGEWDNDLSWCPSQLTRPFEYKGVKYELYCRWRHDDPWTFAYYKTNKDLWPGADSWVSIGSGLSEDDEISDVHECAEKLLHGACNTGGTS